MLGWAAVALSVLLHLVLLVILLVSWRVDSRAKFIPPIPINAALVELPAPKPKPHEDNHRQPLHAKKVAQELRRERELALKRAEEKKRDAQQEELRKQERRKRLEAQKKAERKKETERKKEAERKKEEQRLKAERELAELRVEQERKEQERKEKALIALENERQAAQQLEKDQLEQSKYIALIKNLTSQYWNRPPSARNNMEADIRISLSPFGDVLDLTLVKSSGNEEFDRSVIQAIRRASPFTEINKLDRRLFDQYFRRFTFRFRPEDLLR